MSRVTNGSVVYDKPTGKYKAYRDGKYFSIHKSLREAKTSAFNHHWLDGEIPDPDNYFGFIYEISDKLTGMKYIGYRQYRYFTYPCMSSNSMDHPEYNEACWVDCDWNNYISSSKVLQPVITTRFKDFEFKILSQHRSKLSMMLEEIKIMQERDVLEALLPDGGRMYWNQHIGGAEYNLFGRSYKIKHGYSYHPLYHTWKKLRKTMSEEWSSDPQGFCDTIGVPKVGYAICKKNETKPMSKGNWKYSTLSEVHSTSKPNKKNTSGYTGVVALANGKAIACVYVKKARIHIGTYATVLEAAMARDEYIKENNLPHSEANAGKRVTVSCTTCGKEFKVKKLSSTGRYYCSSKCGKGKLEMLCAYCGELILRYPSQLKKAKTHFCDKVCYDTHQREANEG